MQFDRDGKLTDVLGAWRRIFGAQSVPSKEWQRVEKALGLRLPEEMHTVAEVFRGGRIGGLVHFDIAAGEGETIVAKTLTARKEFAAMHNHVVLAESSKSLAFLSVNESLSLPSKVWSIDIQDKARVMREGLAPENTLWPRNVFFYQNYGDFFATVATESLTEARRRQITAGIPRLASTTIQQIRHRWSEADLKWIWQMLKTGKIERQKLPSIEIEGHTFVDLRGITLGDVRVGAQDGAEPATWADVDLSYCRVTKPFGQLRHVAMRNCRMLRGDIPQSLSCRFDGCDFSGIKLHGGSMSGEFRDCSFVGADLHNVRLRANYQRCNFSGANLFGAELSGTATDCVWEACKAWPGLPVTSKMAP